MPLLRPMTVSPPCKRHWLPLWVWPLTKMSLAVRSTASAAKTSVAVGPAGARAGGGVDCANFIAGMTMVDDADDGADGAGADTFNAAMTWVAAAAELAAEVARATVPSEPAATAG